MIRLTELAVRLAVPMSFAVCLFAVCSLLFTL
jgi:hypothetical protein